jgi:hypothetical protein
MTHRGFIDAMMVLSCDGTKALTANMGFSAMLAEEYILIDISLSAVSWCDFSSQGHLKFIQLHNSIYL